MAITRANSELLLVARAEKLMSLVGFAVTVAGSNADLLDPLASAFRRMGYELASPAAVTDTDLSALGSEEYEEFLDRAELRLLNNILGNFDLVDFSIPSRSEAFSQARTGLEKRIDALALSVRTMYGEGNSTLTAGVIELDFAQKPEEDVYQP